MIRWDIRTGRAEAVKEFFSLSADREELMGDGDTDEADDVWLERQEDLRIEHERQIDSDVRRAEEDYLNPRN